MSKEDVNVRRKKFQTAIQFIVTSSILSHIPHDSTHISMILIGQMIQDVDIAINNACQQWEEERKQAQQKKLCQEQFESNRLRLRSRLRAKRHRSQSLRRSSSVRLNQKKGQNDPHPSIVFYARSPAQRRQKQSFHPHHKHNFQKRTLRH